MVNEYQYISINRVLDNLKDWPMMQDLTLEQVVRHTVRFIGLVGMQKLYEDKIADIDIHEFRGPLPCDCIRILQCKDLQSGINMRSMTDNYPDALSPHIPQQPCPGPMDDIRDKYIPKRKALPSEPTFRTSERVIFTSFPEGRVQIAYKAIAVDENGFPLLIDDEVYLDALENYIQMMVFRAKYRSGKTTAQVYQDVKQDYYTSVKLLQGHLVMPTASELESIGRIWNTMIPSRHHFEHGYRDLGNKEYLRRY